MQLDTTIVTVGRGEGWKNREEGGALMESITLSGTNLSLKSDKHDGRVAYEKF